MAIEHVAHWGHTLYVYGEAGQTKFTINMTAEHGSPAGANFGFRDHGTTTKTTLLNYTGSSLVIQRGTQICVYNEDGHITSVTHDPTYGRDGRIG